MPGMYVYLNPTTADVGPAKIGLQNLAVSQQIYACDPVVWATESSKRVIRKLTATDISNSYQVSGNIAGFLGLSEEAATDSSGNATTLASVVSLAGNVKPIYALPTLSAGNSVDPATGVCRANVFLASNILGGFLWENTTANFGALEGVAVGLLISTISGQPAQFFWSSAASVKVGNIVYVNEDDPYYNKAVSANVSNTTHNPRCAIGVRILPAYQQYQTQYQYAS